MTGCGPAFGRTFAAIENVPAFSPTSPTRRHHG
jgi:hypothetical protein